MALSARRIVRHLGALNGHRLSAAAHKLASEQDALIARLTRLDKHELEHIISVGGIEAAVADAEQTVGALKGVRDEAAKVLAAPDDLPGLAGCRESIAREKALAVLPERFMTPYVEAAAEVAAKVSPKVETSTRMDDLISLWLKVTPPSAEKTEQKRRLHVRRFVDCIGDLEPSKITRHHVIKFRNALEAEGREHSNVQTHLTGLHTLFAVCVSEGKLNANPAEGVRVARRAAEKFSDKRKRPFTGEQVATTLRASGQHDFGEGARKRVPAGRADDMRWIIRLLAYHGARSGEIVQLRPEDVTSVAGIPVLRLTDEDGSIKTANALREIPIHPKCMEIVARATAMKGETRLFMSFAHVKDGAHTFRHEASKFLKDVAKIDDPKLTLHSLRHAWRTVAREVEMPEAVSRAITHRLKKVHCSCFSCYFLSPRF